ncbi:MAG: hypothetical protein J0I47_08330 [Sphingomonas sp.]|uniref:hypothetical protein n=1 Tax=Sphingomonas sp. TaxID=28214 RepID=UPI001AD1085F|nr:hypothetical protein [Sphingomonas sp.]MBN8808229.1 hypothetical protein [Sphingomonas sp.]
MRFYTFAAFAALLSSSAAQAQDTIYWQPLPSSSKNTPHYYVPAGTPLMLSTRSQVSTKDNKSGDRLYLDVMESVVFRGQVVIPAGSVAVGEIARAERNGHFGQKGKISIRLSYVQTPWGPVKLQGSQYSEGRSGTAASVATIAFVSVLGFLIHGTSATIPDGTKVQAYLAEPLMFTASAQQSVAGPTYIPPKGGNPIEAVAVSWELSKR